MITEPKVRVIRYTPDPEKVVSIGAKLCYSPSDISDIEEGLDEEEIVKFIDRLVNIGHESPLEHVSFTFGIENVSRALTHQLVRHRIASYSQKSQRYVKEGQFEYVVPEGMRKDKELSFRYQELMGILQEEYTHYVKKISDRYIAENKDPIEEPSKKLINEANKYAIENARYILPNATETKIIMTINARSLINFFKLRTCRRAQTEIRDLAEKMYWEVVNIAPSLFKNQVAKCVSEGKCPEGNMTCSKPRYDLQIKYRRDVE